jgi:primosomal protein N' (replication factor Y)
MISSEFALVAIDRAFNAIGHELTYAIPEELRATLAIGCAVRVPLARKHVIGYIVGFTQNLDFEPQQLRSISGLAARAPIFDENALRLARWMSAYYHVPLAECLACCMPQGWQAATERKYSYVGERDATLPTFAGAPATQLARAPRRKQIAQVLMNATKPLTIKQIKALLVEKIADPTLLAALAAMVAQGIVAETESIAVPELKPRRVRAAQLSKNFFLDEAAWQKLEKNAPKQAKTLRGLQQGDTSTPLPVAKLAHDCGADSATLRALEKKGWIEILVIEQARTPVKELPPPDQQRVKLTGEQRVAVTQIAHALESGNPQTLLLQGVTASGKTEVYLHAIEKCLQLGKRALVLVPEIALTAQTVEIFQRRFQERVAILHSALSAGERFDEWRRARAGRADIMVGARSAVFAPCRELGLIIIDEEHDHSYKQDSMPRYHARDVALKRAAIEGAVLVLGSATPALESYHRAVRGEYSHVRLTKRVADRQLPAVEVVDMTGEAKAGTVPVLSARLQAELCETLNRGEQAIVFLNRRGFATYVQCVGCGYVARCAHCDVSLTFHRGAGELRCHHCGKMELAPEACPQCNDSMLGFSGTGTEKVESEVAAMLARSGLEDAKILRLDRDTTMHKGAHGKILGEFRQGKAQVLIGTQMVTKGLDFPNVTLVGVISADTALNVPDFRAAERTFQLLAQVAGRAGRGDRPGKVLIQALATDHYAIEAARSQDYEAFVQQEIELRQSPPYPPYSYIVNIISSNEDLDVARQRIESLALKFHEAIANQTSTPGTGCELLGPVECPIARVKNKFRFHLLLRDRNRPRLHRVLDTYDKLPRDAREGLTVDVDAMTIL